MKSVKVVLRNYKTKETIDYNIIPADNQLAQDWTAALTQDVLQKKLHLEKNFCFHGFPNTPRNLQFLCDMLNKHIENINLYFLKNDVKYLIEEYFCPDSVRFNEHYPIGQAGLNQPKPGLNLKHSIMNALHNHFEVLQGTVHNLSEYFKNSPSDIRYSIRQLNNLCHEIETLVLSQRKLAFEPEWARPSQITTFLQTPRHTLTDEHRKGFAENSYNRELGGVYMHWCQIGKTLFEVYKDEGAPELTDTVCEAITHLQYYSGEFDIEWSYDVMYDSHTPWHIEEMDNFTNWLQENNLDPADPKLSLGHLKLGEVDLLNSFGTTDAQDIWQQMGDYLDIYKIECGTSSATYDYHWSDSDHEQRQLESLR